MKEIARIDKCQRIQIEEWTDNFGDVWQFWHFLAMT
jgi:hypothetical protein